MRISMISFGALLLASAAPAMAQDAAGPGQSTAETPSAPPAFTITGGGTAITDYRFRGLTQSDEKPALQATLNVNTSAGFYVGTWLSSIDGGPDGSTPLLTGYGDAEIDLYAGFTKTLPSGLGVDVGLLYYYYGLEADAPNTDFFEPYASLTYTVGPVGLKAGAAYAWGGQKGLNFTSGKDDNIYVYGEGSIGIPTTPVTLKGHLGYTNGSLGLANINATDDSYYDWSVTAEVVLGGMYKIGASYVDTNVSNNGGFAQRYGRGATGLAYIGFSF